MKDQRDIDKIIDFVKQEYPEVCVWQLQVKNPHDDDGIWYFGLPENSDDDIQIENSQGQCPFILETNRNPEAKHGDTVEQVVSIICEHLRTSKINE